MVSPQTLANHPYRKGPPDEIGLAIAQAAQDAARPAVVILFGSRARGDWRKDSDVDLLVISDGEDPWDAQGAAHGGVMAWEEKYQSRLHVDIIPMSREEFDRCRRAKQHIAGQADTYGVNMSGEELEFRSVEEDGYPDHWPATAQRIRGTESWMQNYSERIEADHWDQQATLFEAQQAVENALKGVISAHNEAFPYTHDLLECWNGVRRLEAENPDASELLNHGQELFEYVYCPNPARPTGPQDWLTMYAAIYRYREPDTYMSRAEKLELYYLIQPFVEAVVAHILQLSGATARDVYPDGLRPWERHKPESGTATS